MMRILLFLLYFSPACFCLSGTVSYGALELLHPEMKNFHFGIQRFFLQDWTREEKLELCRKISLDWSHLIHQYKKDMLALRRALQEKKESLLAGKKPDAILIINEEKKQAHKKMRQVTARFHLEKDKLMGSVFLSRNASQKKLDAIRLETKNTAQSLRKQHELETLYPDGSRASIPRFLAPVSHTDSQSPDFLNPDFTLTDFLNSHQNTLRLKPLHPGVLIRNPQAFTPSIDALTLFFKSRCHFPKYPPVLGELTPLTGEVLLKLYKKYNMPETLPHILINFLRSLSDS